MDAAAIDCSLLNSVLRIHSWFKRHSATMEMLVNVVCLAAALGMAAGVAPAYIPGYLELGIVATDAQAWY